MANHIGNNYCIQIFGQSHAPAIGVVIEGIPAGFLPDWQAIHSFMARRAPGSSKLATQRKETDEPIVLSGLNAEGKTCGAPLAVSIENSDHHSADYASLQDHPRPGHADYSAYVKYGGENDVRGGGQFSGRLTAPLCFAGAIAMQILSQKGIQIKAHIASIANVSDDKTDALHPKLLNITGDYLPTFSTIAAQRMEETILNAKENNDSVGGIIECFAINLPAGIGEPMFDGVENAISRMLFAIPGVRGVEFGDGFGAALLFGSQHNDSFTFCDGNISTATNHHGGVLGGITTGMPLIVRVAIKPTPSIAKEQTTVSLSAGKEETMTIKGRHDPCIVPRAVPVVEAAVACALLDMML